MDVRKQRGSADSPSFHGHRRAARNDAQPSPAWPHTTPTVTAALKVIEAVHGLARALARDGSAKLARHPPPTNGHVPGELSARRRRRAKDWNLTTRQAEVLNLVVQGLGNKEVAERLGCKDCTVEAHLTRILRKAGVKTRAQLIAAFWSPRGRLPASGFPE